MDAVLRLHRMWLSNPSEGRQAVLHGAPLNRRKIRRTADLRRLLAVDASFAESRFYDADLSGSELCRERMFYHARFHHSRALRIVHARRSELHRRQDRPLRFFGSGSGGSELFPRRNERVHFPATRTFRAAIFAKCGCAAEISAARICAGATGLTQEQIAQAIIDESTMLP